jgi:hypothetical protein
LVYMASYNRRVKTEIPVYVRSSPGEMIVSFGRAAGVCASVLLFSVIFFLAVAARADGACWASKATGERASRNFYGSHTHIIIRLYEDRPMRSASESRAKVRFQGAQRSQGAPGNSGLIACLGILCVIALSVGILVWRWNRSKQITINLIRNNPKLAAERNEEFYGLWYDTIPDQHELEGRRDAYPGQEPKLSRVFQIDFSELAELPKNIKLIVDSSEASAREPNAEVRWSISKQGFLLAALLESLPSSKWLLPYIEEWISTRIDDLSAMIDREADAYLARKRPEFQLAVFLNAIHSATTFQMACEMSKWFIRQHARDLAVRRSQLISKDIYGVVDSTKWQQEKRYFFSKVMLPALGLADDDSEETNLEQTKVALFEAWHLKDDMPIDWWIPFEYKDSDRLLNLSIEVLDGRPRDVVYSWRELFPVECRRLVITEMVSLRMGDLVSDWIEQEVAAFASRDEEPSISSFDGHEYEEYCAGRLRDAGWETRYTPKSGDQGVDIIAERDGIRVAIQCKNYKQPVGNKAVQEVLAGKSYERADFAAVVSPASYTPAATQLASATGVLLLHHRQLAHLARLMHEIKERRSF